MIGFIKGEIISLTTDTAVVLTQSGVGFEALISGAAYSSLVGKKEGALYTYMQVREDGVNLFGFATVEEKEMFLKLTSVSGVGPKMGIAMLSTMSAADVAAAIAKQDVKRLSGVKGLGKKTAERIILELREKVSLTAADEVSKGGANIIIEDDDEDAMVALASLGFTRQECARAIARAKESGAKTVEDIIMVALKGM